MEKAEEASSLDPQCTTTELKEIVMFTLGSWPFMHAFFETMEDESIFDISDDIHLFSFHHVYVPMINRSLNEFIQQMNNHPVLTKTTNHPYICGNGHILGTLHFHQKKLKTLGWI